jgi:tetratricopeptide (TPR) repeat protein
LDPGRRRVHSAGLLYEYVQPSQDFMPVDWKTYYWTTLDPKDARDDWFAHNILYEVYLARARDEFEQEKNAAALQSLATGAGLLGDDADAQNNAGALCAQYRAYEAALEYFNLAEALSPDQREAHLNAARTLQHLKRYDEASALLEGWLAKHPEDSDARELNEKIRRRMTPAPDDTSKDE